jgi:hypothetical protein
MGDISEMAARFEAAAKTGDFNVMGEVMQEYASDDFVEIWPQSGERLTIAALLRMRDYPAMSGTSPKFTYKRMLGGGDVYVVEGSIDYGDGVPVSYVGVGEIRDGKIFRVTEYFANPFEQPEWRKGISEVVEPVGA